jgi:hypothetical protein
MSMAMPCYGLKTVGNGQHAKPVGASLLAMLSLCLDRQQAGSYREPLQPLTSTQA